MHPLSEPERIGLRRLLDVGAINEKGGVATTERYIGLVKRHWATAEQIGDKRWLIRLTDVARKKAKVLRIMSEAI